MKKILSFLVDFLFPTSCIGCETLGCYLCGSCKLTIATHPEICPYSHLYSEGFRTHLDERSNTNNYLDGCLVGFRYDGYIKKLIQKFKYHHQHHLSNFFAYQLGLHVVSNIYLQHCHHDNTVITWVPSHRRRKHIVKGYNQSQLLAESLAQELGLPCQPLAKKIKHTPSQTRLSKTRRHASLKGAFCVTPGNSDHPTSTIIIVDDVTTTGSTLNLVAQEIKKSYPFAHIRGVVIARHG